MNGKGFLSTLILILFVQFVHSDDTTTLANIHGDNFREDDSYDDLETIVPKDNILGLDAAKVAFHLRENLINLLGYLMYQITVDTEPEVFHYMHKLKLGMEANLIDAFKLIPVLPQLIGKRLDVQLDLLLEQVKKECKKKFCQIKCSVRMWMVHTIGIDMNKAVGHLSYSPFLKDIVHRREDVYMLEDLIRKLEKAPKSSKKVQTYNVFSKTVERIFVEILKRKTSLTSALMGYLIPFYPWPLHNFDVNYAVSTITHVLISDRGYLLKWGVKIRSELVVQPFELLAKLMAAISNSGCDRREKMAAKLLLQTLRTKLSYPNYRRYDSGVYVEAIRLWEILDLVDRENYPLEIVLARERIKRYVDKIIFHLNYRKFIPYKYKTPEGILIAFLEFLLQEAPYPPITIKLSMNALRAYVLFRTGPQKLTYNLFTIIIDGFLAPDLIDEVTDQFLKIKTLVLDESNEIMRVLKRASTKKCLDLLACYFEIMAMLKADNYFKDKMSDLQVPACILKRFLNEEETSSDSENPSSTMSIGKLFDIIDYDFFMRDAVLSAKHVREYIVTTQEELTINMKKHRCTKHEALLDFLEYLVENNAKYPMTIVAAMEALIAVLKFKLKNIKRIDVEVLKLMTQAWNSPFTEEAVVTEMGRIEAIIEASERELDEQLFVMESHVCIDILTCYNDIVGHLNSLDSSLDFQTRTAVSPELYTLNVGDVSMMSCRLLVDIINAVQIQNDDNSELEAAKSYMQDFDVEVADLVLEVDCTGKQVIPCFKTILEKLRFNFEVREIKINIIQYLLMPTTCDEKNCWWYPYEEKGSTILNPLLDYVKYLLTYFGVNEAQSFHIQMDVYQVNEFLGFSDLEEIIGTFKVKAYKNTIEKIERFLLLLMDAHIIEDHVLQSVTNIYNYLSTNEYPNKLHLGNVYYLKRDFRFKTLNQTVRVQLDEIERKIYKMDAEIADLLADLYVDCFTLEMCMEKIDRQLNSVAFKKPAATVILELLNPDSCMHNKTMCPWIITAESPKEYIHKQILPLIRERINLTKIDFIERILWISMEEQLQSNPDMSSKINAHVNDDAIDTAKLINFIEKVLTVNALAYDVKRHLEQLLERLQGQSYPLNLDADILLYILKNMDEVTSDQTVKIKIKEVQEIVWKNQQAVGHYLSSITSKCDTLKVCVQDIFDGLSQGDFTDKNVVKLLLELFLSPDCLKSDCYWKALVDTKNAMVYLAELENYLKGILNADRTPFHVKIDIADVLAYLNGVDVLKDVNSVIFLNKNELPKVLHQILQSINKNDATPHWIKVSLGNILNYVDHSQLPVYLHVSNLIRIVRLLQQTATGNTIKAILNNANAFLKNLADDADKLLKTTPVNCTTFQTCLDTLYVGMEMSKNNYNDLAQIILTVLKPSICTIKTCPWIRDSVEIRITELKTTLLKQLRALVMDRSVPVHIKLNAHLCKNIVRECLKCLSKIPVTALDSKEKNELFKIFLNTVDEDVALEHGLEHVKNDLAAYLSKGVLPKYMDIVVLQLFADLLKKMSKSLEVQKEIERQKVKIAYEKDGVRTVMLRCPINCLNVRRCVTSMEHCLNEGPNKDDPHARIVAKLIRPGSCSSITCLWLPPENRNVFVQIYQDIKKELEMKVHDDRVPAIIRIMMKELLDQLELEAVERYLRGISVNNPNKLLTLLNYMKKDRKNLSFTLLRLAKRITIYLMRGKIPDALTLDDLPGLVKWLIWLSSELDVKKYMKLALNIVMKESSEVEKILKKCPVKCIKLRPCLTTVRDYLKRSESIMAVWLIRLLFPVMCVERICPWMKDDQEHIEAYELPSKNLRTVSPEYLIIYFWEHDRLKHVTLKFTDEKTALMLEALTFIADTDMGRKTVISPKSSTKKYILDYTHMKGIYRLGSAKEALIDFSRMDCAVVCVPFHNGHIRPLKFDLTREDVREVLSDMARKQKLESSEEKPRITLTDAAGAREEFVIDVTDQNALRSILEQTIDDVIPTDYTPVFFWPQDKTRKPWRSAIIEQKSPIETYLRNLPGHDYGNEETPLIVTADGIISMDFDVNSPEIIEGIETSVDSRVAVLDLRKQRNYMLYVPFPFHRNMIPLPVNFNNPRTLNILMDACKRYAVKSHDVSLIIRGFNGTTSLKFNFYGDVILYLYHNLKKKPQPISDGVPSMMVIIPIDASGTNIVLDLNNPKVREVLLEQFDDMIYSKRLLIINIPDDYGGTIPVGFDPDDPVVVHMLTSLSESTLAPMDPVNGTTASGTNIILTVIIDEEFKTLPIIIEDTVQNKKVFYEASHKEGGGSLNFVFSAGSVTISETALAKIARTLSKVKLPGPTYIGTDAVNFDEIVLPLQYKDKLYYVTVNLSDREVLRFLRQSSDPENKESGIMFNVKDRGKMTTITLPTKNEDVMTKWLELATRIEIQQSPDTVMIILAQDKRRNVHSFILNLSNSLVLNTLRKFAKNVSPKSKTRGLYHYLDKNKGIVPIVLDYSKYNYILFRELQQETPTELRLMRVPNTEGPVPLIAFIVEDTRDQKRKAIILNPTDLLVWQTLLHYTNASLPHTIKYKIQGVGGKRETVYIDKTNSDVIDELIFLSKRTVPIKIPIKPIPLDGSSTITVDVREGGVTKKKTLDTRDEKSFNILLKQQRRVPFREPRMMVLRPDGTGVTIRIDTRRMHKRQTRRMHEVSGDSFLVVKPSVGPAIVLDVGHPLVLSKLMELAEPDNENAEMVVFDDSEGQVHLIRLNTKNATVIEEFWLLQQLTTPSHLRPFVVIPYVGRPCYVFTVIDNGGNNRVIILNVTNSKVRDQLIGMWDASAGGTPLTVRDNNGNPLTIFFDLNKKDVVQRMIMLMNETVSFHTPIVSGENVAKKKILKIPQFDGNKKLHIVCNISNSFVVDHLLKIPGRRIMGPKGAAFMLTDTHGELTTLYLDLSTECVMLDVKKVCPTKTDTLNPGKTLILDVKNKLGQRETNVLNLGDPEVVNELMRMSIQTTRSIGHSLVDIPLIDETGTPRSLKIDTRNAEMMALLRRLTRKSLNNKNIEIFSVPDDKDSSNIMVIFGSSQPLLVDQSNPQLVNNLLAMSTPYNPNVMKVTFTMKDGWTKTGYYDLNNPQLMGDLKKIVDQHYEGDRIIPPATQPERQIIKIPCMNADRHSVLLFLDLSQTYVTEKLKEQSLISSQNGKSNMKINVMKNSVIVGTYKLDTTNLHTCEELHFVSFFMCYTPEEGTLLIMNTRDINLPVVILDLMNPKVMAELQYLSEETSTGNATHMVVYSDDNEQAGILKVNIRDQRVVKKLIKLAERTPAPIAPIAIANPYGKNPYVAFTVRANRNLTRHILLNLENPNVIKKLAEIPATNNVTQPLQITYEKMNGKLVTYVFDASDDKLIEELHRLTKTSHNLNDAILNVPQKNARLRDKLILPVEHEDGISNTYIVNVMDKQEWRDLVKKGKETPTTSVALVIYSKNIFEYTLATRIAPSVFRKQMSRKLIANLDAKFTLLLGFRDQTGVIQSIILNTMDKKVFGELIKITDRTPIDKQYSTATLWTIDGDFIPINLDLNDMLTQNELKELMVKTPKPTSPMVVGSPFGPKPLLVFTIEGELGDTVPILIDLNNYDAVKSLDEMSNPDDGDSWSVTVPGISDVDVKIYVNPHVSKNKNKLKQLSSTIDLIQAPITFHGGHILILSGVLVDEDVVNIPLNITDKYVSSVMVSFVKDVAMHEDNVYGIKCYLQDSRGINVLVLIDSTSPEVVNLLIELGKRVVLPSKIKIKPNTGPEDLLITTIPMHDEFLSVCIDPNDVRVIDILKDISEPVQSTKDTVMYMQRSASLLEVNIDRKNPLVREEFLRITEMAPLEVCPLRIVPPGGVNSIISIAVNLGNAKTLLVIDLNDQKTIEVLSKLSKPADDGLTSVEFVRANGRRDRLNLNLSDSEVASIVKRESYRIPVYYIPRKDLNPILVVNSNGRHMQIDADDLFDELVEIGDDQTLKALKTELELKTDEGFSTFVWINFDDLTVKEKLKSLAKTQLPFVHMYKTSWIKRISLCPVTVVPPGGKYPLVTLHIKKIGAVTFNINEEVVLNMLMDMSKQNDPYGLSAITIDVPDGDGNAVLITIDSSKSTTYKTLRRIPKHDVISFKTTKQSLPKLIFTIAERPIELDLNSAFVLGRLQSISQISMDAYRVNIPLPQSNIVLYLPLEIMYEYADYFVELPKVVTTTTVATISTPVTISTPAALDTPATIGTPSTVGTPATITSTYSPGQLKVIANPGKQIYWTKFNLTNMLTHDIHSFIFDMRNSKILKKLNEYSMSLPKRERIQVVTLNLPKGLHRIYVNPYNPDTFKLFRELTIKSTGKSPEIVRIRPVQLWWNFTLTDAYHKPIKIELDVNNANIVKKIRKLSAMFVSGRKGVIVKGEVEENRKFQILLDETCPTTMTNLMNMVAESKGARPKPLKPLCPHVPQSKNTFVKFELNPPGVGRRILVKFDIGDKKVMKRLLELDRKYVEGSAVYILKVETRTKKHRIRLNVSDLGTLKALIKLSKESSGVESIPSDMQDALFKRIYRPMFLTIELRYGSEYQPITVDLSDEKVVRVLEQIQSKDVNKTTVIKFKDSENMERKLAVNIGDRQVVNIMLGVGVPTIALKKAVMVKLLTLIIVKQHWGYTGIQLDLADRQTIIFFVELVRKHSSRFGATSTVEVRDDNGQYVGVDVDFYDERFVNELMASAYTSREHQIEAGNHPYFVMCLPTSKAKYDVLKMRLNKGVIRYLSDLPPTEMSVIINVMDYNTRIYIDPGRMDFLKHMTKTPNIAFVQPSRLKPVLIIYIPVNGKVSPIYLSMKDQKTLNKLLEMHNSYAMSSAKQPMSLVRYMATKGKPDYLFLHLNNRKALSELSRLGVQIGNHLFVRQQFQKIILLKVPQRSGTWLSLRLNVADRKVIDELRALSNAKAGGRYVYEYSFQDAFGESLHLKLDFNNPDVVGKLISLSTE